MQIRTVTVFDDTGFPPDEERLARAGRVAAAVKAGLEAGGYTVQTTRLALPPLARVAGADASRAVVLARFLEDRCATHGLDYATIGPARAGDPPALFDAIAEAVSATTRVFASALLTDAASTIVMAAIRLAAGVMHRLAGATADGFANLRFGALANVPPGVPFLPAAYHDLGAPAVAVGLEAADLAVQATAGASTLADAHARLVSLVERETTTVVQAVGGSCPPGVRFTGVDCSLAPFPEAARSIGTAFEALTGGRLGERGTLAAVAFVADALDRAAFRRTGYSGVFLPVFEDAVLAARATEACYTVGDLLLWSAVCGTGLDTVPLPGDITAEALSAILLDVAALALRLDKPLSARLMPIPGKAAGDLVTFDFPYFAPSRVLAPGAGGIGGLFARADRLPLAPREHHRQPCPPSQSVLRRGPP